MTACKITASKISYTKAQIKKLSAYIPGLSNQDKIYKINAALDYAYRWEYLAPEKFEAMLSQLNEMRNECLGWEEFRGEAARQRYSDMMAREKGLYDAGLKNNYLTLKH
jgi:hypothetical protein